MLLKRIQWSVEKALVDVDAELARDVWRLGLLRRDGARQNLDMTTLTQPWLRELFRDWAREALGTTRNAFYLNATLCQMRRLSESLRTRADGGNDMTAVGRRDIEQFLMRLAGLTSTGRIANVTHCDCVIMVRSVLRRARDRGLTAPGGPLHGLPDTFAVYESDNPHREERDPDDEVGRSLPNLVIKQLASGQALAFLTELSNEDVADAVELLIRTGRRPTEICHLTETCLQWDERVREDGSLDRQPVLVYRPEKTPKRSKRLPVHAARGADHQARARAHPGPLPQTSPPGSCRCSHSGRLESLREGADRRASRSPRPCTRGHGRMPELLDSDGTAYDRERVYALRVPPLLRAAARGQRLLAASADGHHGPPGVRDDRGVLPDPPGAPSPGRRP